MHSNVLNSLHHLSIHPSADKAEVQLLERHTIPSNSLVNTNCHFIHHPGVSCSITVAIANSIPGLKNSSTIGTRIVYYPRFFLRVAKIVQTIIITMHTTPKSFGCSSSSLGQIEHVQAPLLVWNPCPLEVWMKVGGSQPVQNSDLYDSHWC